MEGDILPLTGLATMKMVDFTRLSRFIHDEVGIRIPPGKKTMLEARLQKRLRSLHLSSFGEYAEYLFSSVAGQREIPLFIDAVATNKTDFFRESAHFEFLSREVLPFFSSAGIGMHGRPLAVWSAGCSTGEEPYTVAMVLSEYAEGNPGFRFIVVATDISCTALERAKLAVYDEEKAAAIPSPFRRKYLLRSRDRSRGTVRIVPEIREKVGFRRLNLTDEDFMFRERMDVIFCRNVIIYFDRPTQERVLGGLCRSLMPGGVLFVGHSETLSGMDLPLVSVASTVYRKPS